MNATFTPVLAFQQPPVISRINSKKCEKISNKGPCSFYSDEAIIEGLKARDICVVKYVYKKYFNLIRYMVTSNSGNEMDAEDLFQDAMVVLYQNISKQNLNLTSSLNTYLYSICWHLWLQRLNKRDVKFEFKVTTEMNIIEQEEDFEEILEESDKYRLFQRHFSELSLNDQKVLKLYLSKTTMKVLANIMGFKSANYAKVRKYVCKEKLKNLIVRDPQFKEYYQLA